MSKGKQVSTQLFRYPSAVVALTATLALGAQPGEVTFSGEVLPVLQRRCAVCHQGANAQKGLRVGTVEDLLRGGESGPAVVPGKPDASALLDRVSGDKPVMPPVGEALSPDEVAALRAWIAAGAEPGPVEAGHGAAPSWWSLRPLLDAAPPEPTDRWERSPIDGFLLAAMRERDLSPSIPSDRATLIRRLSFDLLGLPPGAAETEAFERDTEPDAYERLVDRMLASPAYGERWAQHWLDVARFGESNGYEQNHLRSNAWPYRDWVVRSLNEDKPYNRMIVEQLAGDRVAPDDPLVQAATGFLVAGPHDTVSIKNPSGEAQKRANHLDDMIMATSSAFLGLTVHCARCHDHKFDPIRNEDYYRMQAAFAGVWHGERTWDSPERVAALDAARAPVIARIRQHEKALAALRNGAQARAARRRDEVLGQFRESVDQAGNEEAFDPVAARHVRMTVSAATLGRRQIDLDEFAVWTAGGESRNVALGRPVTASSTRVDSASPDTYSPMNLVDGKYDKRWISAGGLPARIRVDLARVERIDRVQWSSDRLGGFGGRYSRPQPEDYAIEVSVDGERWTTVATSEGRLPYSEEAQERLLLDAVFSATERHSWEEHERGKHEAEMQIAKLPKPRTAFLGRFDQPSEPSFVMVRGDPMSKGVEVAPGSLSTLSGLLEDFELSTDAPESERRLALARWIASDDNALAARVIVNRTWMHHFGRPLVRNPSDFGINGGEPTHPKLLDWLADRLVHTHRWRLKPLHKDIVMSAAYRQSGLFREDAARIDSDSAYLWRFPPRRLSAEELRDAILAASGSLDRRMGGPGFRLYRYTVDNVATYYPLEEFSSETFRRSVYHQHARSVKPALLGEFDCPDTSLPAPKRISTTSPLQALNLLNNAFSLNQSAMLANRIRTEAEWLGEDGVDMAWRLALAREPTAMESAKAKSLVAEHGLESLARALLNSNEFLYVF